MGKVCFGVDLGGTTIKFGLFKDDLSLIKKWEKSTRKEENGSYILEDIKNSIEEQIIEHQLNREQIIGVGIGLPGCVTKEGIVLKCVNLGWGILNVEDILSGMLKLPVKAVNDANAAAMGELYHGGGKGYQDMLMVTLGTGVGGAVIIDGKIIPGSNGGAGEIGHMPIVYNETEFCSCGKKGCLEQVASATGIVKEAKKILMEFSHDSPLRSEEITAKRIFDLAIEGDELSTKAVDRLSYYLGIAISCVASVVNPEVVVIGGGVSRAGDYLLNKIKDQYLEHAFLPCRNAQFHLATLGNDAGIYGAATCISS